MRFSLIDRITSLQVGERIEAVKCLTTAEDYLHDHFPRFPVMPGVLMLEALFQASGWLVRASDDFRTPLLTLREAKNIKYADFVRPGQVLGIQATIQKQDGACTTLKAEAAVDGRLAVSGRLVIELGQLPEKAASRAPLIETDRRELQQEFALLCGSAELAASNAS